MTRYEFDPALVIGPGDLTPAPVDPEDTCASSAFVPDDLDIAVIEKAVEARVRAQIAADIVKARPSHEATRAGYSLTSHERAIDAALERAVKIARGDA